MKRYEDIMASTRTLYPYNEESMHLYAASLVAGRNGQQVTIATKSFLAMDDEEAKTIAEGECFKAFPVRHGYECHTTVIQVIREGCYKGTDGNMYNIIIEPA